MVTTKRYSPNNKEEFNNLIKDKKPLEKSGSLHNLDFSQKELENDNNNKLN